MFSIKYFLIYFKINFSMSVGFLIFAISKQIKGDNKMTIENFKAIVKAEYPNAKISWSYLNGCPSSYTARVLTERKLRHTVTLETLKAKGLV